MSSVGVRQRHEGDLVRARRKRDVAGEHGPEERGEEIRPGRAGRALVVAYRRVGEEDREQGSKHRDLDREPALPDGPGEAVSETSDVLRQERVRLRVQLLEHGQAGGGGERVARQGPRLVHGPARGQLRHEIAPAPERGERQAPADHLPEAEQVRLHA